MTYLERREKPLNPTSKKTPSSGTKCTRQSKKKWWSKSKKQTKVDVSFRFNTWFSRLLIRKRKLAVFNKKLMKFSRNKPRILKIKNWHNWRWQCKRKSQSTSFFWMIRLPFSKRCTPKLYSWSTETSRLSRIKVKLLNYSMKLISTFLKLNKNLQ